MTGSRRLLFVDDSVPSRISERGHGSARWTGPQAGGDCDVDEAATAVAARAPGRASSLAAAGMKWCRPARVGSERTRRMTIARR